MLASGYATALASGGHMREFSGDSDIPDPSDTDSDAEMHTKATSGTIQRVASAEEVIRIGYHQWSDEDEIENDGKVGGISLSEHIRRSALSESSARRSASESPRLLRPSTAVTVHTHTRTTPFEEEDIPDPSDGISEDETSL
jgi:hypothetical protein